MRADTCMGFFDKMRGDTKIPAWNANVPVTQKSTDLPTFCRLYILKQPPQEKPLNSKLYGGIVTHSGIVSSNRCPRGSAALWIAAPPIMQNHSCMP